MEAELGAQEQLMHGSFPHFTQSFQRPWEGVSDHKLHFASEEAKIQISQRTRMTECSWNKESLGFGMRLPRFGSRLHQILVGLDYIPQFLSLYRLYNNTFPAWP